MNYAREIMRLAAQEGYVFSVGDSEGRLCHKASFDSAWKSVTELEEATVNFFKEGEKRECMYVVNVPAVDPEETAADFSCDGIIERLWNQIDQEHAA